MDNFKITKHCMFRTRENAPTESELREAVAQSKSDNDPVKNAANELIAMREATLFEAPVPKSATTVDNEAKIAMPNSETLKTHLNKSRNIAAKSLSDLSKRAASLARMISDGGVVDPSILLSDMASVVKNLSSLLVKSATIDKVYCDAGVPEQNGSQYPLGEYP